MAVIVSELLTVNEAVYGVLPAEQKPRPLDEGDTPSVRKHID
jgi:hypothetical protein